MPKKKDKDLGVLKDLLSDLIHAREWQKARVIAQYLIKIDSKDLGLRTALGMISFEINQLDEAEECFRHVLDRRVSETMTQVKDQLHYRG